MKKTIKYILLFIYLLIVGLIFYSSLENSTQSSKTSNKVTDIVINTVETITNNSVVLDHDETSHFVRKVIGHFGSFFLLGGIGVLMFYLFLGIKKKAFIVSIVVGLLIAITAECLQLLSEGRACQVSDVFIDYGGYILSSLIIFIKK